MSLRNQIDKNSSYSKRKKMKKRYLSLHVIIISFSLLVFQCDKNEASSTTQEQDQEELKTLGAEIENLINTSKCTEANACKFIGFGDKPCGGPWRYIVYSSSIDTEKLENLVRNYNEKEKLFNEKWGVVSDCALAIQPTNMKCENNICVPVY